MFALSGSPAALGPLIAGYLYNATNSYSAAFELSAALNLAALLLVFLLKHPRRAAGAFAASAQRRGAPLGAADEL
jgi:hypothetical protein